MIQVSLCGLKQRFANFNVNMNHLEMVQWGWGVVKNYFSLKARY